MNVEKRRENILKLLAESDSPLSGTDLAKCLAVSRQVIVQDIALLRAVNKNILSTNKGYLLFHEEEKMKGRKRSVKVRHTQQQILDELCTIVDLGGHILDVVVAHEIYGQITCDLIINSRQDAKSFVEQCEKSHAKGLSTLTDGVLTIRSKRRRRMCLTGSSRRCLKKDTCYLIKNVIRYPWLTDKTAVYTAVNTVKEDTMEKLKKILNKIFIDGLSGMATGLFATLIIGTIISQIGSFIPGNIGTYIYMMGKVASSVTGAGIGVGVALKYKESPLVVNLCGYCRHDGCFCQARFWQVLF